MNTQTVSLESNIEKVRKSLFPFELAGLILLIFAKNIIGLPIPASLLLAVTALIAIVGNREEIVIMGICCIPFYVAFQYKYTLLFCMIIYTFKYPKDIKMNQYAIPLLIMMVWEFLHALKYEFALNEYFRNFSEMIFVTFLMMNTYKKFDYGRICRYLAICVISMIVMVLWGQLQDASGLQEIFSGGYRLGNVEEEMQTQYGIRYNANALGYMCLLPVMGFAQLIVAKQQRPVDYVLTAVLLVFGILTLSRTYVLCVLLLALLFIWAWQPNVVSRIKNLVVVALILTTIFLVVQNMMPYVFESFFERLQEKDFSNGRMDLMAFFNEHIFSSLEFIYFGVGLQDMKDRIQELLGFTVTVWNTTHNGIQEIILCWGFPGLVMFGAFLWSMISSAKTVCGKFSLVSFIPLIVTFFKVQAGQLISSSTTLLALAFIYIGLCQNFKGEQHDNNQEVKALY